jgi:hypothetical protein|tara:strand:- start:174 stop:302 length:129 start_codon:yes stop_codon:yes gene_type:complete
MCSSVYGDARKEYMQLLEKDLKICIKKCLPVSLLANTHDDVC